MKSPRILDPDQLVRITGGMETGYAEKRKEEPPQPPKLPGYDPLNETGHSEN